jgi:hypothetical protein
MNRYSRIAILACVLSGACWAVRCITRPEPGLFREYEDYVSAAEAATAARFDERELSWVPASLSKETAMKLASGHSVRLNLSDSGLNQRLAGQNGTVIHWIGATRIPRATLGEVKSVLEDYEHYASIYAPIIYACRASRGNGPAGFDDVVLGLRGAYRIASVFPQQYTFRAQVQAARSVSQHGATRVLRVHVRSNEIRESRSGVAGRDDFLEPHHDHGIMWALNAYWRAWERGPDVDLEFETITLARSVQAFACRLGIVPVPRSIVSDAMEFFPAESVRVILDGTRTECVRRAAQRPTETAGR